MNQGDFPQKWIKQGYAEWEEYSGERPEDQIKLYESYCARNEIPFIEVRRSFGNDSKISTRVKIRDKQLSREGQEQLEALFEKYATWNPKSNEHLLSYIDSHMVVRDHIPLESLEELMPQVVTVFRQHLEPWIHD